MNILITNDDGIDSQGIYHLVKEFVNVGNVIVSAPDRQRSACSHSITMHKPISVKEIKFFDLNCKAYAVSGTPVDCVKLAYEKIMNCDVDIIISGINDGANLGTDVIYSGTVSAAIEGSILGIPSIAVSLVEGKGERDYGVAAYYTKKIYDKFIYQDFKSGTILNVNIPFCKKDDIKGISATCLGIRKYYNSYEERKDPRGNTYYWLAGDIAKTENGNTTDIFAVENYYVSITPMHFEFTRFDYINIIKSWSNDNI